MSVKWSILVATTSSRLVRFFTPLVLDLENQVAKAKAVESVEVIALFDSKSMTIGEKRNILLGSARGEYISYIDDDDVVSSHYVERILREIENPISPDLVTFNIYRQAVGTPDMLCRHRVDVENSGKVGGDGSWVSLPNHIMVWKRNIAQKERFPDKNWMEDYEWSRSILGHVKTFVNIDDVLYWYRMQIEIAEIKGVPWKYHGRPIVG